MAVKLSMKSKNGDNKNVVKSFPSPRPSVINAKLEWLGGGVPPDPNAESAAAESPTAQTAAALL